VAEREIRILNRADVERCVASFDPLDVVESVLRNHADGETVLPAEAYMEWTNRAGAYCRSIAMPGGVLAPGGSVYGMKVINAAVSNPSAGLDRAGGVTMLFDPETARPRLIADAACLSALRTAAYTLVSLRHLGPEAWECVSIVGCGTLAREHIRLLAEHHPGLSKIYVYDTDACRADALAGWTAQHFPGLAVVRCDTARDAVAASTVVVTVTTSRQPYIEPGWFRPATFVAHVSLDDVTEEVFLAAEAVFVDDVALVRENPRRIMGRLMTEGKLREPPFAREPAPAAQTAAGGRPVVATLGEVLTGRRQAVRPAEGVVVSNPFGMSILDIGLLNRVAAVASMAGLGRSVRIF
jgi:N-[(2S)-2-amino-2-carboxyethyl]-L-glutamate dehydrogenase